MPSSEIKSEPLPYVSVDDFEGPFDVLLAMARAQKIDITRISLVQITDDFLEYIREHTIPTDHQLDFLLVASTLLLLKLQRSLPQLTAEEEEEINELTDRLQLYQLYRTQGAALCQQWGKLPLSPGPYRKLPVTIPPLALTEGELQTCMQSVQARQSYAASPISHLRRRPAHSLEQCTTLFNLRLAKVTSITFADMTNNVDATSKAVFMLAMLEMTRQGAIAVDQGAPFTAITISSR